MLTRKWHCWGNFHFKVELDDVELTAIIDLRDAHDVTSLVLFLDSPLALANDEHIVHLAFTVLWPFCSNFITVVEELYLARAKGADASDKGWPTMVKMRSS
jgi:hypothetical protein